MTRTTINDPTVRLLSTAEVCELLHISKRTLFRRIGAGEIVPVRLSARANRFRHSDVTAFVDTIGPGRSGRIFVAAYGLIAETAAEETRPLCPVCGLRRVNHGDSQCGQCEQRDDDSRRQKREWWDEIGSARRSEARQAAREEDGGS